MIGEQNFLYPELGRAQGRSARRPRATPTAPSSRFRSVFDAAGDSALRMPQLRAATRLVRLREQDAEATESLRAVYETFTEGFDSPDLVEARAVLAGVDVPIP